MDNETIDLSKRSCGSVGPGQFDGWPVNAFLRMIFYRAGIAPGEHPLFPADLPHTQAYTTAVCDRLPSPFPPTNYGELKSVQDALDCVNACKIATAAPANGQAAPPKWDQEQGAWIHPEDRQPIPSPPASVVVIPATSSAPSHDNDETAEQ